MKDKIIKTKLKAVIQGIREDVSVVTRVSNLWGSSNRWAKAVIIVAIAAVPFLFQFYTVPVIALASLWVLQNHYQSTEALTRRVEKIVVPLGEMLQEMLSDVSLSAARLSSLNQRYETLQADYSRLTQELSDVKDSFTTEIKNLKGVNLALKSYTDTLTNLQIGDSADRARAQEQLDKFLRDGTLAFNNVSKELKETVAKLNETEMLLKRQTMANEALLERNEVVVDKLEASVSSLGMFSRKGKIIPLHSVNPCYTSSKK